MTSYRGILAMALTLAAAFAAGPASAAPEQGAEVVRYSDCISDAYGTFCWNERYTLNQTETPSGNASVVQNGQGDYQFTDPEGCTTASTGTFQRHWLSKNGNPGWFHEQSSDVRFVDVGSCSGTQIRCVSRWQDQIANGTFRFDRVEFECKPKG